MNKQREALKIALEVLDSKHNFNSAEWRVLHYRAFQVIREALAEPEKANQCGETCERAKLCAVCANGLAEPEQEPVADSDLYAVWLNGFHSRKPLTDEQVEDEWERITGHSIFGGDRSEGRSMYLSPDEVIEFARAIERAHGIGGEA
jgi:hypothetical protein